MRSCAYCGRDLGPEEKCNCHTAQKAAEAKSNTSHTAETKNTYTGWQENTYRTGYTKKKKKFNFRKPNFRKPDFYGAAQGVSGFTKRFIHDPVNAVSNPGNLNTWQIILILLVTAVALSMCGFFAAARLLSASSLRLGISGTISYTIGNLIQFALTGAASVFVMELVFIFVLYCVNRFVLRQNTRFMTFAIRPVAAMVPIMIFAILGAAVNFFSIFATVMLVLTGFVMSIVLTYEALRAEWSFSPAVRIMYTMGISYFIFFVIVFNVLNII